MKKDFFGQYASGDSTFHIVEHDFTEKNQPVQETLFTLGNGYMGSRGIMEENPIDSIPGTFITGMFGMSAALKVAVI